ncbi:MAG: hypothetical protein BV457_05400 [Thermoplasmata archaeon M9B1D]|nr:MAG: hypothetical protein BV457_05400 [Thermoplasmata archaeon M9B1D]
MNHKCKICGKEMREELYGEEMSIIHVCPDEDKIVHIKKEELIYLLKERKRLNKRIKEIRSFID